MIIKDGIAYEVKETAIDIKALEIEKVKLTQRISAVPALKTKPDEETLGLWNSFIQREIDSSVIIQKKIDDIDKRLTDIANLKTEVSK